MRSNRIRLIATLTACVAVIGIAGSAVVAYAQAADSDQSDAGKGVIFSGGDPKPSAPDASLSPADEICAEAESRLDAVLADSNKELMQRLRDGDAEAGRTLALAQLDVLTAAFDRIRVLPPPEGLEAEWKTFIEAAGRHYASLEQVASTPGDSRTSNGGIRDVNLDLEAKSISKLARDAGLKVCFS